LKIKNIILIPIAEKRRKKDRKFGTSLFLKSDIVANARTIRIIECRIIWLCIFIQRKAKYFKISFPALYCA